MSELAGTLAVPRSVLLALVLAVAAIAGGAAVVTADGGASVKTSPAEADVNVGGQATVDVTVVGVDDVGAYTVSVELSDPETAAITAVETAGDPIAASDEPIAEDGGSAESSSAFGDEPLQSNGEGVVVATVTLEGVEAGEATLQTTIDAVGDGDGLGYEVDDRTDETTVRVTEPDADSEPDAGDETTSDDVVVNADVPEDVAALHAESATITSDGPGRSSAQFSGASPLASVTFDGQFDGRVTATELDGMPDGVGRPTDGPALVTRISVPDGATDSDATLRLRVPLATVERGGGNAGDLQLYHHTGDVWETYDARVVDRGDEFVTLEAETPGFSLFAVGPAAQQATPERTETPTTSPSPSTASPTTTPDSASSPTPATSTTDSTGQPGFGIGVSVLALLAAIAVRRRS